VQKSKSLTVLVLALAIGCGGNDPGNTDAGGTGGGSAGHIASDAAAGGGAAGSSGAAGASSGCSSFVTEVTEHEFGPGQNIGQLTFPAPILGPPRGGGQLSGSLDVVSLGNGGTVTLQFGESKVVDGPGIDFLVFENAFEIAGSDGEVFAELATVEVSVDGVEWHAFACTAESPPYGGCAGHHPVYANAEENEIDPLDPSAAGGDGFDLSDIGVAEARFVRITDREDLIGQNGVFDLDAVGIVNAVCP
jgi:hypothetical protein